MPASNSEKESDSNKVRADSVSDSIGAVDRLSETEPHVRYAEISDDGDFSQKPLISAKKSEPDSASFVTPAVYFLDNDLQEKLTEGRPSKSIQEQCEWDQSVFYNIIIESDGLEPGSGYSAQTVIDWVTSFAENWLGIEDYSLYYSGNRSIHLHSDVYVTHSNWKRLRTLTKQFNEEEDAELDPSIYKPKAQFRLPGARHEKTGLYKVPIDEEADRSTCIREARSPPDGHGIDPITHYWARSSSRAVLPSEIEKRLTRVHIKEGSDNLTRLENRPFSPYANVMDSGDRSLIAFKQKGEIFQKDGTHYVPCWIFEAAGGDAELPDNDGYVRYNSVSPIKLSPKDVEKWDLSNGDCGLIIGRANGESIIHEVDEIDAKIYGEILRQDGKAETLNQLSREGYDIGTNGVIEGNYEDSNSSITEPERLKRQMENGEAPFHYPNCFSVGCHLLKTRGFQAALDWFERVMGERYDEEETYWYLRPAVEMYEDYSHVDLPPEP